jgi:hypothetical protein
MRELVENAVKHSFCEPCRARTNDPDCPFRGDGCIEYQLTVKASAKAVADFARLIQNEAVWRIPGVLRDTIIELGGSRP